MRAWKVSAAVGEVREVREAVVRVSHIGASSCGCGGAGAGAGAGGEEILSFVEAICVRREARRRRSSVDG